MVKCGVTYTHCIEACQVCMPPPRLTSARVGSHRSRLLNLPAETPCYAGLLSPPRLAGIPAASVQINLAGVSPSWDENLGAHGAA